MGRIILRLNVQGIQTLMAGHLSLNQMRAIRLMSLGESMTEEVTKNDLIQIIAFLCQKLGWIEHYAKVKGLKKAFKAAELLQTQSEPKSASKESSASFTPLFLDSRNNSTENIESKNCTEKG